MKAINNAIFCSDSPSYGPTFGSGYDFCIGCSSNLQNGTSRLGVSYKHPKYQAGAEANKFLAGSDQFLISEIEVYQVIENV